ncbi:MAG: ATP-binding protein [Firmicutes bacterium]|nr:ATP-binding protein [Bacillota bacterium]
MKKKNKKSEALSLLKKVKADKKKDRADKKKVKVDKPAKSTTKKESVKKKKERVAIDVRRMTLITGIHDNAIDYGSYLGAAIEIPPVELRFFSDHRRTNAIDHALGNVLRTINPNYSACIVKLERPMVMDEFINSEYDKIETLKRSYERGVFTEEELKSRIELVYDRLEELERINYDNKILIPHYYLVLFESDKRQLENQVSTAMSILRTGEMKPHRLNDKELAVFLRYSNSVDFDEREIEDIGPEDYLDFILPDTLEFRQKTVEVNNIVTHNFRVTQYPLEVGDAWGANLFDIPGTKVVMKFTQMDRDKSIRAIDRSIAELNSQLEKTGVSSKVIELQTHIETLSELLVMLQNDNEALLAMNLYITAYDIAMTRESKHIVDQPPESTLPRVTNMKKDVKRNFTEKGFRLSDQSFLQTEAFIASQIHGYDPFFRQARGVPGSTAAGVFPWIFASLNDEKGVTLGESDGVPAFINFFRRDSERVNSNMVIVGKSGSGKSYATKSILSNLAADDSKIFVLDPENEYTELAANLNGKYINVANASHGRINPFHIITSLEDDEDDGKNSQVNSFAEHLQFLEEFFRQILPDIDSDAMEYLNNIINRVYIKKGIDQYTNLNQLRAEDYPTFDDLYDSILEEFQNTQSEYLKTNLRVLMSYVAKFSTGGRNSSIWNGPSTLSTTENFIVFNFQSLLANRNNTVANAQMLLVLKYLDNEIIKNREYNTKYRANRKIIIVIDEAHVFIDSKFPLALDFMYQMAKRIRKYNGMQIVITQNIKDFVGSEELARKSTAIINACQYSFIFSLAPNDMHDLCTLYEKAGGISEVEQEQIMTAPRGRAFVVTGPTSRTTLQLDTPPSIETMFSEFGYEGIYSMAENQEEWEELIAESKKIREGRAAAAVNIPDGDESEWDSMTGLYRGHTFEFIELEEEEAADGDGGDELVLFEEIEDLEELAEEVRAVRENATSRAMDMLHETNTFGAFSPAHLQQLGFEALVSEIRRTVKAELQAELGTGSGVRSADTESYYDLSDSAAPMAAQIPTPAPTRTASFDDLDDDDDLIDFDKMLLELDQPDDLDEADEFDSLFAEDDDDDDFFASLFKDSEDDDDKGKDVTFSIDEAEDMPGGSEEFYIDDFAAEDFDFAFDLDESDEAGVVFDDETPSDVMGEAAKENDNMLVYEVSLEELMEMSDDE